MIAGYVCWAAYLAIFALKAALSLRYVRLHPEPVGVGGTMTVLQPILSGDPWLEATLSRNLVTAPPETRFVWLVDEDDAEALRVAERSAESAPGRIMVVPCPPIAGDVNPKTAKLQLGLERVETEFFAVLDDDAVLDADNLRRAIHALASCDCYTGLPRYDVGATFWSSLTAHFVNDNSILTYLPVLAFLKPLTVNGMFYAMRTGAMNRYGGFEPVLPKLCDDYAIARLVQGHGGVVRQGTLPVTLRTSVDTGLRYARLMHRWNVFANVLVFDQPLHVQALLFVLLGLPSMLLWASVLMLALDLWGFAALVLGWAGRYVLLRFVQRRTFGAAPKGSWPMSLLAELLQPIHLLHALASRKIRWRTRTIRVHPDGTFTYLSR